MAKQAGQVPNFITQNNQPLIGIFLRENDHEMVQYFTEEAQADAVTSMDAIQEALSLAGSWHDLDWDEMERELYDIGHENQPTPPITL